MVVNIILKMDKKIIKSNNNGEESQKCLLNNYTEIEINCFNKNECDEVIKKIIVLKTLINQMFLSIYEQINLKYM